MAAGYISGDGSAVDARRVLLRALGMALMVACAGLPGIFEQPDVNLQHVALRGVSLTGGTLDLTLGVYNPNKFDLEGTKLQLGLDVEDSHVGDLVYDSDFQAQQGDTTVLTIPLAVAWSGLAGAARSALNGGELPYTIKGQLTVATPIGEQKVPFTHSGRAPLSRVGDLIPRAAGQ
ncbi:MAG: LEA type 2 family protein [Gemmatimonadales bacterium]